MSILWCGGEDIDFQNGNAATPNTNSGRFRSTYSRCDVTIANAQTAKSSTFPGGAVTSCWWSFRLYVTLAGGTSKRWAGLIQSGGVKGLWLGTSSASSTRLALISYDGTTQTQLAAETGNSVPTDSFSRIDMQLVNYGSSSTINVYLNSALLIAFTGDSSISGVTGFDQIGLFGDTTFGQAFSEFIVADEDVRAFPGLATLALTGAGTTDDWSGVFSTINQTTFSDANPNFTNTASQDQQFNVTDLPSGTFVIRAIKISARAAKSATPTPDKIKLGYKSGASVAVGSAIALTTSYATYEQLDSTSPITSSAWAQSDINSLQLVVRSST